MNTKKDKKTAPLKPYDDSMWDHWSMYDNIPYVRDMELRSNINYSRVSGNIIKSYRCRIKEPFEVKH